MTDIDSSTKLMGLFGKPVEHSSSPLIQNYIANIKNDNIKYICFDIEKNNLHDAVKSITALKIKGVNITIPYKTDVTKFLDSSNLIVKEIGACNTIKNEKNQLVGYNTDVDGFLKGFAYDTNKTMVGKNIAIIGAGGAARSVLYAINKQNPKSITIINRTLEKAKYLISDNNIKANAISLSDNKVNSVLDNSNVIINTTSVGMHPKINKNPIGFYNGFTEKHTVYDIIYNPYETALLEKAKKSGSTCANGLSMLIFQGILAYEIINDTVISKEEIKRIINYVKGKLYDK